MIDTGLFGEPLLVRLRLRKLGLRPQSIARSFSHTDISIMPETLRD